MPVSGARLGGALHPLSSRTRKQRGKKKSLASSAAADFFPDSLLARMALIDRKPGVIYCFLLTMKSCISHFFSLRLSNLFYTVRVKIVVRSSNIYFHSLFKDFIVSKKLTYSRFHSQQEARNTSNMGDFPGGPVVNNPPSNAGDAGSIPGWGAKIPHAAGQLNPCGTTTEPALSGA